MRAEGVTDGKDGKCLSIVGIDGNCLLKEFLSLEIVFAGHARPDDAASAVRHRWHSAFAPTRYFRLLAKDEPVDQR